MSTIRLRRGVEADRDKVVPRQGEPLFTTDTKRLYIGDGVSAGGVPVGTGETGKGVPAGGTTGQVLAKKSNVAYDTEWVDQEAGGVESVNGRTGNVTGLAEQSSLEEVVSDVADNTGKIEDLENGATMNADTSLAGNGYFLDEDDMASDDDTKVPSQQSVKAYVDNVIATTFQVLLPIGAKWYGGNNPANPSTYIPGMTDTTWVATNVGKSPIGVDAEDTDFDTAGNTGGEKTHTLTTDEMPSHTHIQNQHRHDYVSGQSRGFPGINAGFNAYITNMADSGSGVPVVRTASVDDTISEYYVSQYATATNQNTGGDGAHNNLHPYQVEYIWLRTA